MRLWPAGLVCFCAGGLYGWSALIGPLQAAFGVSTARMGLVFSLAIVSFTVAVIASPKIAPQAHPARRIAAFGAGAALCLGLAALAPTYASFVALFSAGFGSTSGAVYVSAVSVAARSAGHARATPVMVAAFGMGGAVFGPLWRGMAAAGWGLSALWPLALGIAVAAATTWWLAGSGPNSSRGAANPADPIGAAPSRGVFGLIWLVFAFGSFGGLMVLGLAATMMEAAGAAVALSGVVLAGVAVGNTAGRLSVAALAVRYSPLGAVFVSVGLGLAGLVLSLATVSAGALATGLTLVAFGYGIMASAVPALVRAHAGPGQFEHRFARVFTAWGVAGFCAPWASGALFDATGYFDAALWVAFGATVLSGAAGWRLLKFQ